MSFESIPKNNSIRCPEQPKGEGKSFETVAWKTMNELTDARSNIIDQDVMRRIKSQYPDFNFDRLKPNIESIEHGNLDIQFIGIHHIVETIAAYREAKGVKVLVVENVADLRELIVGLLAEARATAVAAASVDEALARLATDRPHVIVGDLEMPDDAGYTLIRAVRGLDAGDGGQTPAVALTTFARREDGSRRSWRAIKCTSRSPSIQAS